jgi:hypothetical protein
VIIVFSTVFSAAGVFRFLFSGSELAIFPTVSGEGCHKTDFGGGRELTPSPRKTEPEFLQSIRSLFFSAGA